MRMINQRTQCLWMLVAIAISTPAFATAENNDALFVSNGLTKIRVDAEYQQKNPLNVVTAITIPSSLNTVGQAINYTLQRTGYQLQNKEQIPGIVRHILMLELPAMHRNFQHVTIYNIIDVLVGPAFKISVNHKTRTVKIMEASS